MKYDETNSEKWWEGGNLVASCFIPKKSLKIPNGQKEKHYTEDRATLKTRCELWSNSYPGNACTDVDKAVFKRY
jgi:hypothetical protein